MLNSGLPEAALNELRLTQNVVRSATDVSEEDRRKLDRRIQAQLMATVQSEERIVQERAERTRMDASAEQRVRTIDLFERNKQTIEAMMIQFDTLITEGVYNLLYTGGMGNIAVTTAPFTEARLLAQQAYSLQRGGPLPYSDNNPAPGAGKFYSYTMGFYAQAIAFRTLFQYRYLLTLQDVQRASIPFPDGQTIEYPDAEWWKRISEKRIARWGKAVDLWASRDAKTKMIIREARRAHLDVVRRRHPARRRSQVRPSRQPRSRRTTRTSRSTSIPSASRRLEKSMTSSTVRNMDLEGVPLKVTLEALAQAARLDTYRQRRLPGHDHLPGVGRPTD